MKTLGIDLAAQPKETAACVLRWEPATAVIESLTAGLDDQALLASVEQHAPAKIAIDAPFGWPEAFVAAVSSYSTDGRWPNTEIPALRLRLTDRVVIAETRQQPLSVSSDRIAITAMRCARILTRLRDAGYNVGRDGAGDVVEVYPAAALRQWELDPRGYKGAKPDQQAKRLELVVALTRGWPWLLLDEQQRLLLASSDHLLDALICAVMAQTVRLDLVIPIPPDARELARVEGWIYLPIQQSLHSFDPTSALDGH